MQITLEKGESKIIVFTILRGGSALDMSQLSPTFRWIVKNQREDTEYLIEKTDDDFVKDELALGYAKCPITATDTANLSPGTYLSELKTTLSDGDVDLSGMIEFVLDKSAFHD